MLSNLQREYKQNIYFKFRELYQDYRISDHCRASNKITENIENYLINKIENELYNLENKTFEELLLL